MGKIFKYGGLAIEIEHLRKREDYQEYGIRIDAPGHSPFAFKVWHPEDAEDRDVAQVLVYDLIAAYEAPMKFFKQHTDPSYLPKDLLSEEVSREFIRAADILKPFLQDAHRDVYKEWSMCPLSQDPIERGPREWFPGKKG